MGRIYFSERLSRILFFGSLALVENTKWNNHLATLPGSNELEAVYTFDRAYF